MGSTPPASEEGSASSIPPSDTTASSTIAGPSRTIHSFFGGPSASTSAPSSFTGSSSVPVAKRRKKKDENQAKLGVVGIGNNGESENGVNWVIGKPEPVSNGITKKAINLGTNGEEAEMKEMVNKGKGQGRTRGGKRKSDIHDVNSVVKMDDEDLFDPSLSSSSLQPQGEEISYSPPKKKGRSRKSQLNGNNSSSIDHPSAPTSSPFPAQMPISTSGQAGPSTYNSHSHRPSIDFEVTGQSLNPFFIKPPSSTRGTGSDAHDAIEVNENSSPDRPILIQQTTPNSPTNLNSPMKNGPKKIAFAADKKPQHSFFSRSNANANANVNSTLSIGISGENGSLSVPENGSRASSVLSEMTNNTILSGEEGNPNSRSKEKGKGKEKQVEKDKKKVHGFFKNAATTNQGILKNGWGNGIKDGEELIAPLPRGNWPNHSQDTQTVIFPESQVAGPSRRKRPQVKEVLDQGFWSSVLEGSNPISSHTPSQRAETFSVPNYVSQHPAFTSIPTKSKSKSNRESWSDRYKPLKSSECLYNEVEATYLKDWLSTLSVGHHEVNGRKVVRKVRRGSVKSGLVDGWIVDDLGSFGDPHLGAQHDSDAIDQQEEEIELDELDESPITLDPDSRPTSYPSLLERLTNTILLTGPNGSGKSAAVYAAAHELGWDVFEVFPGMGKRTSANLMSWVGDVGKNHMVAQEKKPLTPKKTQEKEKEKKGGLKSFFGNSKKKQEPRKERNFELGSQGSIHEPIDIDMDAKREPIAIPDDDDDVADKEKEDDIEEVQILGNSHDIEKDGKVRQSLILIDEADILFDEESTFWPALISLISESRRPVILTCNDHDLIPRSQLPLQAILQFRPPPSYIALPYLQSIAIQESKISNRSIPDIQAIYHEAIHQKEDILDKPLPPNGNERIPYFDLRKAIGQLQLDRNAPQSTTQSSLDNGGKVDDGADMDTLVSRLEITSYVDAWVSPKDWIQLETIEVDRHYPTTDDVLGIHALIKPEIRESYPYLAGYDYSTTISDTLINLGGGRLPKVGDLGVSRMKYIRSTLPLLDPLIPLSAPLLPNPSLFLYTLPTLLGMIEVDDILQSAEEEAVRRGEERLNRKTGRPMRGGQSYTRWLGDLDSEGEDAGRGLIGSLR